MTQDDATKNLWPNILQCLFVGNSIINNLSEPQIQLDELQKKLPKFQEYLSDSSLPVEKKKLACNELERQIQYMTLFAQKLNAVTTEFAHLNQKEDA